MSRVSAFCHVCGEQRAFQGRPTSHVLHLLISLVTAGLWIPIWIIVAISHALEGRRCAACASKME